jgi:hypothetical protein
MVGILLSSAINFGADRWQRRKNEFTDDDRQMQ